MALQSGGAAKWHGGGALKLVNNRKRNRPWMPEGGAQSKGKDRVYNGQERNSENLLSFHTISFFSLFRVFFWTMGSNTLWNKQSPPPPPSFFFLGRGKINKSTADSNQFKHWAGVWNLCFREISSTQPPLSNQFCLQMNLHRRIGI